MTDGLRIYLYTWIVCCLLAAVILIVKRNEIALFSRAYLWFLTQPWKLITFLIAAVSMTVIAPYTGDPTWDYFDAAVMAVLTYLTAPWVLGVFFRGIGGRERYSTLFAAACLWLFSASWFYDLYLLLKDGYYPITWLPNLFASSILYICAGLMWNLDWREGRGVIFAFMVDDWPNPRSTVPFKKVVWFALPLMILVAAMILPFLI